MITVSEMRKSVNKRLRSLLAESGKTQKEIAKGIGINNKLLNSYLKGDITPNTFTVCKICEYFDVSADWLLGLSERKEK